MRPTAELRWTGLVIALILSVTAWDLLSDVQILPVGGLIVPVVALALVARAIPTAIAAAVAVASASLVGLLGGDPNHGLFLLRLFFVVAGAALAVVLAVVRTREEERLAAGARDLAAADVRALEGGRLALALDAASLGVWEWQRADGVIEARGVAPMFGLKADGDVTAALWETAVHPEDRADWASSAAAAMDDAGSWYSLHRAVGKDGVTRWLEARGEPMRDDAGVAVGMLGVLADVTERRGAERDARDAAELTIRMVDSLAILGRATSEADVKAIACDVARTLFGSDTASYWNAEREPAVLEYRLPAGLFGAATEADIAPLFARAGINGSASMFVSRADVVHLSAVANADHAPASGLATPIRVADEVVAYLALGWMAPQRPPAASWLAVVDRFAVNVALALAVVRRQSAQVEAQRLTLRLQNGLLPTRVHIAPPLAAATVYRPGERRLMLGGDFLDLLPHEDGRLSFVVGDVAGHGPEQAALGTILRSAWTGLASSGDLDPGRWAAVLHDLLVRRREDESTFVTVAMGVLDPAARTLTYVLAGHPPPLQLVPVVKDLPMPEAPPLGMLTEPIVAEVVDLPCGFGLLIFTDGLYDGFDVTGDRLGFPGLQALVASRGALRTAAELAALVNEVEHRNGGPLADDVAALLLVHDASVG